VGKFFGYEGNITDSGEADLIQYNLCHKKKEEEDHNAREARNLNDGHVIRPPLSQGIAGSPLFRLHTRKFGKRLLSEYVSRFTQLRVANALTVIPYTLQVTP
jgi:hypothetical protein